MMFHILEEAHVSGPDEQKVLFSVAGRRTNEVRWQSSEKNTLSSLTRFNHFLQLFGHVSSGIQ